MNEKQLQMNQCLSCVRQIMNIVRPEKKWRMEYQQVTETSLAKFTPFAQRYFHILTGDEYIFIWDEEYNDLLYAVNVSADSVMTALSELMSLLSYKF